MRSRGQDGHRPICLVKFAKPVRDTLGFQYLSSFRFVFTFNLITYLHPLLGWCKLTTREAMHIHPLRPQLPFAHTGPLSAASYFLSKVGLALELSSCTIHGLILPYRHVCRTLFAIRYLLIFEPQPCHGGLGAGWEGSLTKPAWS
jgi:hypothetical protein